MNIKKKLTNFRARTTMFCIAGAILVATIGISAISSATPVQGQNVFNSHGHSNCSSGQGGCTGNSGQVTNTNSHHFNENCNTNRNTDHCKTNSVFK